MIYFLLFLSFFLAGCNGDREYDYQVALDPTWQALEAPGREVALRAFSEELLREIGKVQRVKIAILDVNWDFLLPGLKQGKYQGILSNLQPYLFYEKTYDFSTTYLFTGPVIVFPAGGKISSMGSLEKKIVGVIQGSNSSLLLEKYPGIIQRTYLSMPAALEDIVLQKIDAALVDVLQAEAYCADLFQGKLQILQPPLTEEGLRLITLKDKEKDLVSDFNAGLQKLKDKGIYQALLKKWQL